MMELINLEGVSKTFCACKIETRALNSVDLVVNSGESLAIMGVSGSGKSTLLNIITMLEHKSGGKYIFMGEDVDTFSSSKMAQMRAKHMGIIFQSLELIENETIKSNVSLGLYIGDKYKKKEFNEVIDTVLMQVGMSPLKKKKVKFLSGGQKQRVAIARALVNDPDIILADEPTSALDSATANEIIDLLLDLQKMGKTIIVVTHDINVANKMDRIVTIKDGVIQNN